MHDGVGKQLGEQLRLIMEPTQTSKLAGNYSSGKRLNMSKLPQYVASGYRKDKIWLRRTNPNKREYKILIAIDDSESMKDTKTKQVGCFTLLS